MTTFQPTLFRSFWMGGFESACHITSTGHRLDMLAATQHDRFVSEDYRALAQIGMVTARDTVRWHRVEVAPNRYDFSSVDAYVDAANDSGVQIIWDLLHYGWPDGLDIFAPDFVARFAAFCEATARHLRDRTSGTAFYTPINELSFLAWAAGEVGWFHPFGRHRGGELKRQLVRAWIAAVDAIRSVDSSARFVSVEPLIHTVPRPGSGADASEIQNASQWEAWDMITGRAAPELGGDERFLDVAGVNFYHDNQWEVPGGEKLHWHLTPRDSRWVPFSRLLCGAYQRYQRPMIIGETSHVGSGRAEWIRELTDEVIIAVQNGVPLEGICLYPIIDRFEWNDPTHWHNSGLWDFAIEEGIYHRVLNEEYAGELARSRRRLAALGYGSVALTALGHGAERADAIRASGTVARRTARA